MTASAMSRRLRFRGIQKAHRQLVAVDVLSFNETSNKLNFKILLARPIEERDTEYNYLNSSHWHSTENDLSFSPWSRKRASSFSHAEDLESSNPE